MQEYLFVIRDHNFAAEDAFYQNRSIFKGTAPRDKKARFITYEL